MTSVDCYIVHMTILSPMGRPIFACFRFRYRFHLWKVSHPDSWSDPIGGSEPGPGCETIYWDSLLTFSEIGVPQFL